MKFDREISYMKRMQSLLREGFQANNFYFEEDATPYSVKRFLPGHVYTFEYIDDIESNSIMSMTDYLVSNQLDELRTNKEFRKELNEEIKLKSYRVNRPYFDYKPIGISLGGFNDPSAEYILNLKCMPVAERNMILEIIFRVVVPQMLRYGVDADQNIIPFEKRINDNRYTQPFLGFKMKNITDYVGAGIYFWVNKYNKERIRNVKLIDFDSLPKLGFVEHSRDAFLRFNGTSLKEVQSMYLTKVKNR